MHLVGNFKPNKKDPERKLYLKLDYTPRPNNEYLLDVESNDAGKTLRFLRLYDYMRGGSLSIKGKRNADKNFVGHAKARDFNLVKTNVFAKLLTLASFTGIVDMLSGDGIAFTHFDAPFEYKSSTFILKDAKAFGNVIGISLNGAYNAKYQEFDVRGLVAPAYGLNTFLGKIALVGTLLSGKDGTIFAVNYQIAGNIDEPVIDINPLSALSPNSIKDLIKKHAVKQKNWEEALDEVQSIIDKSSLWSADKRIGGKRPREHQLTALENWEKAGKQGIFEHATGSGKTFTAMCAIRKELEFNNPILILVPSIGLLKQWRQELSDMFSDIEVEYLICGDGNNLWKEGQTLQTFTSPKFKKHKRITIATMQTASSTAFMNRLCQSESLMVVADEVHRMGSVENRSFFSVKSGSRLGLSATPRRYGDPIGTQAILSYFGSIIQPIYSLKNAIDDRVLCKYFYHPITVALNQKEQEEWDNISNKISKLYAITQEDSIEDRNKRIAHLLIERSRIIKNAKNKINTAVNIVTSNYKDGQKWIVYCDNQTQLQDVLKLLNASGIRSYEYHSELSNEAREETLKYFDSVGGVVVSIKCLDEGIDIPATSHALILASSQNPREFIQRRGRILRRSKDKHFAYLYDAIVIPSDFNKSDKHCRIIESELNRAIQFGEWSEDKKCIYDLKIIAIDNNVDYNNLNRGVEDE